MIKSTAPAPIVVFDLDGTLAHSAPDLIDSLNLALTQFDYAPVSADDIACLVGQGAKQMIDRALTSQNIQPEERLVEELIAPFLEFYNNSMPGKTRYFPGVDSTLDDLLARGFLLAVCTNKSQAPAERLLDFLEPKKRFAAICGGNKFAWRKPDPRHISATVAEAGGDIQHAVMVGDSFADVQAAKQIPIPVIGVDFGYSDVPIGELEPDYVVSDFGAVSAICKKLLKF